MKKLEFTSTNNLKDWLFALWERNYHIEIDTVYFNTTQLNMLYDEQHDNIEFYNTKDKHLEDASCIINLKNIKNVEGFNIEIVEHHNNNQKENKMNYKELTKIDFKELTKIIAKEWKTSYWMKINGFLFFMYDCYQITTDTILIIYDKESDRKITSICIKDINSLIIDDEVIL